MTEQQRRPSMRAVVTGASRGIGLELVRQLAARGDTVHAAVRDPARAEDLRALAGERVTVHQLDVVDVASVRAFAAELEALVPEIAIDLLLNSAGVYGGDAQHLRRGNELDAFDFDDAVATYQANALGALRVTFALLPALRRATGARIVHVTSGMGSITDNKSGSFYAYRMSKAALNMASRTLAVDLRSDGIASAVINPGWVKTDMGGPSAPTLVEDSVRGILREVDGLSLDNSGAFLDWKGRPYPW